MISDTPLLAIGWALSGAPVPYRAALRAMDDRVDAIANGHAPELVWLLEHPPVYTGGVRAREHDILRPGRFDYIATNRGGEITYHGPGQRIAYVMLNVRQRFAGDVHALVRALEQWVIDALERVGVAAFNRPGRPGVWVTDPLSPGGEAKIAALGLRIRRGICLHGVSLNVAPDLTHFAGIVPCGLAGYGVTSLAARGEAVSMADVDVALLAAFEKIFSAVAAPEAPPPATATPASQSDAKAPFEASKM